MTGAIVQSGRVGKKKTVRLGVTACTALAAGVGAAIMPAPAQAQEHAWQVMIQASSGIPLKQGIQVCGHNQSGVGKCDYAKYLGEGPPGGPYNTPTEIWSTPNWWWASNITLWWRNHHSISNAGCNVQLVGHSGGYANVVASFSNHNCAQQL
jgi:hypothetical protein